MTTFNAEFLNEAKRAANPDELQKRLVPIRSSFIYMERLYLVYDYFKNGSIEDLLERKAKLKSKKFSEEVVKILIKELICTTQMLHAHKRTLRGISLSKIFVDGTGELLLNDASACPKYFERTAKSQVQTVGSPEFLAPESIRDGIFNEKSDVWSIAVIASVLFEGDLPFKSRGPSLAFEIANSDSPIISSTNCSPEMSEFLSECLQRDPKKRPEFRELLTFRFFQNMKGKRFLVANLFSRLENASKSTDSFSKPRKESGEWKEPRNQGNSCIKILCHPVMEESSMDEEGEKNERSTWIFSQRKLLRKIALLSQARPNLIYSVFEEIEGFLSKRIREPREGRH